MCQSISIQFISSPCFLSLLVSLSKRWGGWLVFGSNRIFHRYVPHSSKKLFEDLFLSPIRAEAVSILLASNQLEIFILISLTTLQLLLIPVAWKYSCKVIWNISKHFEEAIMMIKEHNLSHIITRMYMAQTNFEIIRRRGETEEEMSKEGRYSVQQGPEYIHVSTIIRWNGHLHENRQVTSDNEPSMGWWTDNWVHSQLKSSVHPHYSLCVSHHVSIWLSSCHQTKLTKFKS